MSEDSATWKRVKFGEVVRLVKETCKSPVAAGIERVIGLEHLEPGDLRVRSWNDVADGTTFTTRVRPGQVLFGKRRAYQRKVAVADFDAVCSGDIYVFESANPERLLPEILPFICQTDAFFEHAVGTSAGSLSPRTNWSSLAEYEFALPPLEEQRRIAVVLGVLQTHVESLGEAIRVTKALRASFAFTWFSREMPLLEIGKAVRSSAFGPRFPAQGYASDDTANAWTVRTTDFTREGISFAKVPGAKLDENVVTQHTLENDDVLLSRSGEYAGMVRVFRQPASDARAFIPAAFLIRFRLDPAILLPDYLAMYCQSPQGTARVRALASGSAQPNISGTAFSALKIPLPAPSEQRRMTAELAELRSALTTLEDREARAHRMLRSAQESALQMATP